MQKFIFTLVLGFATSSFAERWTTLSPNGNLELLRRYTTYSTSSPVCSPASTGLPRVMVTGFGPFMGAQDNISEAVVQNFASISRPHGTNDVYGSRGTFHIGNQDVEICFLVFDVLWDLGGAILATEMNSFKPDFVLLTGVGGPRASIETGALNQAAALPGYNFGGLSVAGSTPQNNYVLPRQDPGVQNLIPMTWHANELLATVSAPIQSLGFDVQVESPGRPSNDYLCNNISFLALHAAEGVRLRLAGELLELQYIFAHRPRIGFFHYPRGATTDATSTSRWAGILQLMIAKELEY